MRFRRRRRLILVLASLISLAGLGLYFYGRPRFNLPSPTARPSAAEREATVQRVIDGDTVELVGGERVRYLGLNSPEIAHGTETGIKNPESGDGDECYAEEAKRINEELVGGKRVRLRFEADQYDQFGRLLAWVYLDAAPDAAQLINRRLVEAGAARFYWRNRPLSRPEEMLIEAEEEARKNRRGLWGQCGTIDGACLVKGNLDRNDKKYYHRPGFKYYAVTQVSLANGDRWFCSVEEAERAGFKRAVE